VGVCSGVEIGAGGGGVQTLPAGRVCWARGTIPGRSAVAASSCPGSGSLPPCALH